MRRAFSIAALLAALIGCGEDRIELFAPLSDDARSALLLVRTPGGAAHVHAMGPEGSRWTPSELSSNDVVELALLEYAESLAQLELPEGTLETTAAASGRVLDPPLRSKTNTFDGQLGAWVEDSVPDWAARVRLNLPPRVPCLELDTIDVPIPGSKDQGRIRVAVPLGGQRLLVAVVRQGFFEISPEGAIARPELDSLMPVETGHRLPDGEIWIIRDDGRVFHGDLETGFVESASISASFDEAQLVGPGPDSSGSDLFLGTDAGELYRGSSVAWELVGTTVASETNNWTRIAWLDPEEVMFSTIEANAVLHHVDGSNTIRPWPEAVYSIARIAGHGPMIGTGLGGVYEWVSDGWQTRVERGSSQRIIAMAAIPGGILFGGSVGVFSQYFFEPGFTCEPQSFHREDIDRLIPVERGYVLVQKFGGGASDNYVTYLSVRE